MAIILSLALVLSLVACDNGGGGSNTGGNNDRGNNQSGGNNDRGNNQSGGNNTDGEDTVAPVIPNPPSIEENPVSDFEYRAIEGGIEITQYIGTNVIVDIPEAIEGVPVISIGDRAFFQTGITVVHVPSSVTNIGLSAFSGNEALTNITMANNEVKTGSLLHFGGAFWRVLDVQGERALIISEDVLESRAYHSEWTEITWEHSDIRAYLNGEFYNRFNSTDQNKIVETTVINSNNPTHGTPGGNDTTDKIFLLSIDEAQTYFTDDASRIAVNANGEARSWWLRSPGNYSIDAAYVYRDGNVNVNGNCVYNYFGGVRPALWLNL
jgi:hypothetical protein